MGDMRGWIKLRLRRRWWRIGNVPSIAMKGGTMGSLRRRRGRQRRYGRRRGCNGFNQRGRRRRIVRRC